MKSFNEMFELKIELLNKFKELKKEIGEDDIENTDVERIFDVYVISFMSLCILGSTYRNPMKVHNDFNAYKKYSLTRFKKEYSYLKKYLKNDYYYIDKFSDFFELVNLDSFGHQKVLSKKNLENSLIELQNTTKNMYIL